MNRQLHNGTSIAFGCRFDEYDPRDYRYMVGAPRELPVSIDNRSQVARIMNQGAEGSCTGHAVCAAAELLYWKRAGNRIDLSQRWAYRKARELDPWPGENYHGSTTRAAIQGWADHGICEEDFWPYKPYQIQEDNPDFNLVNWEGKAKDGAEKNARTYPLLVYRRCTTPYEIKHALHEHGVVVIGATVHSGWNIFGTDRIAFSSGVHEWGGHAFILVGYDEIEKAYHVVNSWGMEWGVNGTAKLSYDDAATNIRDAWSVNVPAAA